MREKFLRFEHWTSHFALFTACAMLVLAAVCVVPSFLVDKFHVNVRQASRAR